MCAVFGVNNHIIQPLLLSVCIGCHTRHRNRNQERFYRFSNCSRFAGFHHKIKANREIRELHHAGRVCFFLHADVSNTFNLVVISCFYFAIFINVVRYFRCWFTCFTVIIFLQCGCSFYPINSKSNIFCGFRAIRNILLFTCTCCTINLLCMQILINGNRAFLIGINYTVCCLRCFWQCGCSRFCHCWHGAQAEGQGGAQQACEKTLCFFHFSTSSLKKSHHRMGGGAARLRGFTSARRAVRGAAAGKRCRAARTVP